MCFKLETAFDDGATGDYTSTIWNAYGIRVYIKNNTTGVGTWYWADAETGCLSVGLDRNATYQIRPISKVLPHPVFDGLTIRFCDGGRPDEADLAKVA